ncbi:ethylene-responsive nuclear family protein [Cucumis melo var. makuwa]|nr:uncharacterized protein LOC103488573 [Cucumis melo]KAA0063755.1 ethylene-responsive nuclear family protein [Cucumis melo var. makuwa]TYK05507.1 ethylene-responsive nuclear family protein [Cucumis melo var. makuwa]
MPLLSWKTTRASRISQIVADFHSPKRAGSLVVETGFPTSIVDLFVKHRDRLRKHSARRKSKKKKKIAKNEFHDSIAQLSPSEVDSIGSSGSCVLRGNLETEDLDEARKCSGRGCELIRDRTETCVVGGDATCGNGFCLFVLKMFVVAGLALSAKKLVVGITLSAFLLFLLEFVGKRAVRFFKPCTHREAAARSLIQKATKHLWIGKDDPVIQDSRNCEGESVQKISLNAFPNESIDLPELSSSIEEIQLVEPQIDTDVTPKRNEDEKRRLDGGDLQVRENERGIRRKHNRRMFEKLVRRKSGSQANEKKNNTEELEFRSDGLDKDSIEEQENETLEKEKEQDGETISICWKDKQDSGKPPGFDEQWQIMEVAESSCEIHGIKIKREESLSYAILFLIVLVGLFGGRFLAVVLATACCFMIKLKEIARRKSLNPPLKVSQ